MTRKEIKEWGQHMADKVFHGRHKEAKLFGYVDIKGLRVDIEEFDNAMSKAGFKEGDNVEIIIRKV